MRTSFAVDWIRGTTKTLSIDELIKEFSYGFEYEAWTPVSIAKGYTHGMKHPFGHCIFWHSERADMGHNLMFTGRSLSEVVNLQADDPMTILKWMVEKGFKFSRIDLAIDIHDVKIDIVELHQCDYTGSINNEPDLYQKGRKAKGGATIYCGSRQSDKFLRIYDKAKEQKEFSKLWTRVEIEIKNQTSTRIAKKVVDMTIADVAQLTRGMILGMYRPENDTFLKALDAEPVKVGSTKNTEHDTYEWIIGSVSKSIARTIIELPHRDVWNTLRKEVDKHIREMAAKGLVDKDDVI